MGPFEIFKVWRLYSVVKSKLEEPKMKEKMASRKLWVTVIGAALTTLNGAVGLVPDETMQWVLGLLMTYLGGQSVVDAVEKNSGKGSVS